MDSISNSLSTQIVATLSSSLSAHVIAAISPQVASILTASETLKTNINKITKVKTMLAEQPGTPKLYSAAVQQNAQTPAPILAALVRAAARDHQILFDPTPGQALFAPEVTSADIAGKMMQAFMASQTDDRPKIHIKAITRLRNGGLIIELTTTAAAQWIRRPENQLAIVNALDIAATIKDRCFSVIVPFLPITSSIKDPAWLRTVEEENEMISGVIESANGIKPRQCRAPNQHITHTIIHFTDPHSANNVLHDGIYIGQEKLHPCKDKGSLYNASVVSYGAMWQRTARLYRIHVELVERTTTPTTAMCSAPSIASAVILMIMPVGTATVPNSNPNAQGSTLSILKTLCLTSLLTTLGLRSCCLLNQPHPIRCRPHHHQGTHPILPFARQTSHSNHGDPPGATNHGELHITTVTMDSGLLPQWAQTQSQSLPMPLKPGILT
ncbi:hypothetical protein CY34DRAFT_106718 [Suillus luteus UH-Slu-Lm8-n1]|uniref:Uncharacterized protein n=1 Tax=Suillus luteus UH-Slu-Lm8-n1 TaxID=930992 RepID=A0A0D0BHW9_9AGAM|nr:hypothetical protein CY34DRAFT_106718 [Suillus luteus UH-Slu-Lm8-n1]